MTVTCCVALFVRESAAITGRPKWRQRHREFRFP
jgi:hypothetical protein